MAQKLDQARLTIPAKGTNIKARLHVIKYAAGLLLKNIKMLHSAIIITQEENGVGHGNIVPTGVYAVCMTDDGCSPH